MCSWPSGERCRRVLRSCNRASPFQTWIPEVRQMIHKSLKAGHSSRGVKAGELGIGFLSRIWPGVFAGCPCCAAWSVHLLRFCWCRPQRAPAGKRATSVPCIVRVRGAAGGVGCVSKGWGIGASLRGFLGVRDEEGDIVRSGDAGGWRESFAWAEREARRGGGDGDLGGHAERRGDRIGGEESSYFRARRGH